MPKRGAKTRAVLYWGALWGILEATAGALMHLLPYNMGAFIWLPLAARCLLGAYHATRSPVCVLVTACAAAALKLTNLLTPLRLDLTLNPAAAIVAEGIAFALALTVARGGINEGGLPCLNRPHARARINALAELDAENAEANRPRSRALINCVRHAPARSALTNNAYLRGSLVLLGANTLWRALYAVYIALAPEWTRSISMLASRGGRARFFITENIVTTIIICALSLMSAARYTNNAPERRAPAALLAGMCALSLIMQFGRHAI